MLCYVIQSPKYGALRAQNGFTNHCYLKVLNSEVFFPPEIVNIKWFDKANNAFSMSNRAYNCWTYSFCFAKNSINIMYRLPENSKSFMMYISCKYAVAKQQFNQVKMGNLAGLGLLDFKSEWK